MGGGEQVTDPATCEKCGRTPAEFYEVVLESEPTDHGIKETVEIWLCAACAEEAA